MPRRRLAVALLVPQPLATEVDGLRRAGGDPRLGRIAPHITLVPPVNVAEDRVPDVLDQCRRAAASTPVLRLTLGAPSTFAPATPLVWLSVGGDVEAVAELRGRLDTGPLARPAEHAFVPHVTISGKVAPERLEAMVAALVDFDTACSVDRLHVLENRQFADGPWGWARVAEMGFARPAVIGLGSLPLELSVSTVLDPEAEALMAVGTPELRGPLVVAARRDAVVVGVATGATHGRFAILQALFVGDGHRGQGVGSHLLAQFTAETASRGCRAVFHIAASADPVVALCRQRGWTDAGSERVGALTLVRVLAEEPGR